MKKILILLLTLCSIAAFSQSGSITHSGIKLRVNDTTAYQSAVTTAHGLGYSDIYWNNQATTPHWDIWNGSSYDHIFDFNAGSGAGVTDGDKGDITVSGTGASWTVDNTAITFAKFQNLTGLSIFGRSANSSGVGADITGTDGQVLRVSGTTLGFGAIAETALPAKYIVDRTTTVTTGATITLDCNSQQQRLHVGLTSFSSAKAIALSNTTNALGFTFFFEITATTAVLTPPSDWLMPPSDSWDGTDWTPLATGKYVMVGSFDGTNWNVSISQVI